MHYYGCFIWRVFSLSFRKNILPLANGNRGGDRSVDGIFGITGRFDTLGILRISISGTKKCFWYTRLFARPIVESAVLVESDSFSDWSTTKNKKLFILHYFICYQSRYLIKHPYCRLPKITYRLQKIPNSNFKVLIACAPFSILRLQ